MQVGVGDAGVPADKAPLVRTHCLQLTCKERDGSCRGNGGESGKWTKKDMIQCVTTIPSGSIDISLCDEKVEIKRGRGGGSTTGGRERERKGGREELLDWSLQSKTSC